jgi:peptidoglycan/xylan/chitin deacetylase (PgdA/CDA1 family)
MGLGIQPRIARATYDLNCLAVRLLPRREVTVITYHRVGSRTELWPDAAGLAESTLDQFEAGMSWLRRYCHPITMTEALEIYAGARPCPSRAVLVTFDDGYRDDLRRILPALRRTGIRPTVFLPTGFVGTCRRFWWDRVGVCVQTTVRRRLVTRIGGGLDLPLHTSAERGAAIDRLITLAKPHDAEAREELLATLERDLGVASTAKSDRPIVLDWDEVRELRSVYDFGAHTVTHPVISRLSPAQVREELRASKMAVEAQLDVSCSTFAIPYGGADDYTAETLPIAAELDFALIFSYESTLRAPQRHKTCALVDRVAISAQAGLSGLAAKITWPNVFVPDWTGRITEAAARALGLRPGRPPELQL